ncbi:MAG: hypothetical protein QS748_02490 [Candidatus Endonucleobacter bathymodioli]|uniref:Uncharacterized protein n=1 Tax=Candidatus Endonucleibacter bathymodioli TaxID=539814 RepID=A0AA90SS01_9GAMM|nr:hypothetical protein [Candidatus Endonucleobacter bathymodioli]
MKLIANDNDKEFNEKVGDFELCKNAGYKRSIFDSRYIDHVKFADKFVKLEYDIK